MHEQLSCAVSHLWSNAPHTEHPGSSRIRHEAAARRMYMAIPPCPISIIISSHHHRHHRHHRHHQQQQHQQHQRQHQRDVSRRKKRIIKRPFTPEPTTSDSNALKGSVGDNTSSINSGVGRLSYGTCHHDKLDLNPGSIYMIHHVLHHLLDVINIRAPGHRGVW